MSLPVYSPSSDKIVHETEVDFTTRSVSAPIHIVQYDKKLIIIAVSLRKNDEKYQLSNAYTVNIRFRKPDNTYVYDSALGANSAYDTIYFEVSEQMTTHYGEACATVEIMLNNNIANTAIFRVLIDRNPIQVGE